MEIPVDNDDGGNNTDNDYDDVDVGDEKEDDILHCASHMIVFTLCLEKRTITFRLLFSLYTCANLLFHHVHPMTFARTFISVETLQTICLEIGKQEHSQSWMTELREVPPNPHPSPKKTK